LTNLDEQLTRAFAEIFAEKYTRFRDGVVSGGPGYYGVRAVALTEDGSDAELTITFRAGVRYCCFVSACHCAYYRERWWSHLRECMDRHGLGHLPLPVIRSFRGIIEHGAVMQPGMVDNPETCFVSEGAQYAKGPWQPIAPKPAAPGTSLEDNTY
jgi:hypothetical protein